METDKDRKQLMGGDRDARLQQNHTEALQKSESYLKAVLDNVLDGIISINENRIVETFNPAAERIFGYRAAEVIGKNINMLMPEPYRSQHDTYVRNYLHTGEAKIIGIGREVKGLRKNGHIFPLELAVSEAHWGGRRRFIGILRDITARKKAEDALRELNASLEQQVAERTELAEARSKQLQALAIELIEAEERERQRIAELLHDDLQQLLAGAKWQLQAVSDKVTSEPILSNVHQILEESILKSRHLSRELSPPVLHHSGLDAGLKWLAQQMESKFDLRVEMNIQTENLPRTTPLTVFLFRAAQELLFNVVKHAGVGSAKVVISGSEEATFMTVSDHGRGFDPAIVTASADKPGFGLLAIRERASYIGGAFDLESAPGKGSRLILKIPRGRSQPQPPPAETAAIERGSVDPAERQDFPKGSKLRVLFADDHKVMRQGLISLIANQFDIQVVGEAENGLEAVELAGQLRPDVAIIDISMPKMDGIKATRHIKADMPEMRIVGLSMFDDEQLIKRMLCAGADAFISKTASSAELLKAIYGKEDRESISKLKATCMNG